MRCKVADEPTDPFIDQRAAELRRPVRFDSRFDARGLASLDAPAVIPLHPGRAKRQEPWIVRPWTLRVSPIAAFATAAALAGVVAISAWQLRGPQQVQVATTNIADSKLTPVANVGEEPLVVQQFTYYEKGLKSISIVGGFNDWDEDSTKLVEVSPGVWTISMALPPGVYEYQFILNGSKRVTDPTMPQVSSDFGSPNSVVTVSPKVPR